MQRQARKEEGGVNMIQPPPPALKTVRGDTAAGTQWVVLGGWGGGGLRKVPELPSGRGPGLTLQERGRIERLPG